MHLASFPEVLQKLDEKRHATLTLIQGETLVVRKALRQRTSNYNNINVQGPSNMLVSWETPLPAGDINVVALRFKLCHLPHTCVTRNLSGIKERSVAVHAMQILIRKQSHLELFLVASI